MKKAIPLLALILRAVVLEVVEQLVSESGHVCGSLDQYWQEWNVESQEDTRFWARDFCFAWHGGSKDFTMSITLLISHRHSEWYSRVMKSILIKVVNVL